MTELSPAAQAVLSAYNAGFDRPVAVHHKPRIAAALRAAATMLRDAYLSEEYAFAADDWLDDIAAELEGATR